MLYELKMCGNPALSRSTGSIVPTALAHFVSVLHFSSPNNFSKFSVITVFVMVICDQ